MSKAQPVTGIAPATLLVLFTGVSKLPKGGIGMALKTFTVIVFGEPAVPVEVTVIKPLGPGRTETWKVPVPTPDVGLTVILEWSEVAVHGEPLPMVTRTVCGLVISEPIKPKFSSFRFTDRDGGVMMIIVAESLALAVAELPPEAET